MKLSVLNGHTGVKQDDGWWVFLCVYVCYVVPIAAGFQRGILKATTEEATTKKKI